MTGSQAENVPGHRIIRHKIKIIKTKFIIIRRKTCRN